MKLTTTNGRFLIFSEDNGIALYYQEVDVKDDEGKSRKKINRIIKNGKREWDWASKTWGQEPRILSEDDILLLNFASRKIRGVETLAIKNSKGSSIVLRQSNFFLAPQSGYLISCGSGSTSRRVHQGGNSWDLFNFQKVEKTQEKMSGECCNFGTYCGYDNCFGEITKEELIPLTKTEWEEISGIKFSVVGEFSWFRSSIDEQPKLYGLHREGDYVLREPFRPHKEMGKFVVYPDICSISRPGWSEELVSGYENPVSVEEVGINIPGCLNFVVANDNTTNEVRRVYFAEFKFFNFPSFWVGYETIPKDTSDAVAGIKIKAVNYMLEILNYKFRRNEVDSETVLNYFKAKEFVGTPADSLAVGNCAIGTWEWMRKIFPLLPDASSVSWKNFPVSIHKEFKISAEKMVELYKNNHYFMAVVRNNYLRQNPISGQLNIETASQLLFNPIEQSIGKIITKWEAKKLGFNSIKKESDLAIRIREAGLV